LGFVEGVNSGADLLQAIEHVEFRETLRGYNRDEVDDFLESVAGEVRRLLQELARAQEQVHTAMERVSVAEAAAEAARSQPGPTQAVSESAVGDGGETAEALQRTLLMAQRFVDHVRKESEDQAAATVAAAQAKAQAILKEAEDGARRIASETEKALREEVTRLENTRADLEAKVEELSSYLGQERSRIRSGLVDLVRLVDERLTLPMGGSSGSRSQRERGTGLSQQPEAVQREQRPRSKPSEELSDPEVVSKVGTNGHSGYDPGERTAPLDVQRGLFEE
jgi:cell division initiation protein